MRGEVLRLMNISHLDAGARPPGNSAGDEVFTHLSIDPKTLDPPLQVYNLPLQAESR